MTDYTKLLRKGKENATPAAVLADIAGLKGDTRALRYDIARSRAAGQLICSNTYGGYYLPANREELQEFVRSMEERAKKIMLAVRAARREVEQLNGQLTIEEYLERTGDEPGKRTGDEQGKG